MAKKLLLIYHYEDNDGVGSAALLMHYMMNEMHKQRTDFELLPSNYNSLADFFRREDIVEYLSGFGGCIMTDVSSNEPEKMIMLKEIFGDKFVWVDHHKPIIDASVEMDFDDISGFRDTGHSAFKNMWRYLYNISDTDKDDRCPAILKRMSGWDSFTFDTESLSKEECKYVNQGVTNMLKLDIDSFLNEMPILINPVGENDEEVNLRMDMFRSRGKEICDELDASSKKMIDTVGDDTWTVSDENHTAMMIVTYGGTSSEVFKSLIGKIRHGIVLKRQKNGNWTLSLYNTDDKDDFHCGDYLKSVYGGGGHQGAAGCTLSEQQFVEMLGKRHV